MSIKFASRVDGEDFAREVLQFFYDLVAFNCISCYIDRRFVQIYAQISCYIKGVVSNIRICVRRIVVAQQQTIFLENGDVKSCIIFVKENALTAL